MKKLFLTIAVILLVLFLIKRNNMTWRQSFLKTVYPLIMLKGKLFPNKTDALVNEAKAKPAVSFYSLKANTNTGEMFDFQSLAGKKVLIVNTASDCGYTGQYEELEQLHQQYKDLVIIGFPANDFKEQEKKDDAAIAAFCKKNYGVSFLLMQKTQVVKGADQNLVYQWLTDASKNGWCEQAPVWNFSKYILNEEGVLTNFFSQNVSPLSTQVTSAVH
jgi:glutathione peroxidase